MSRGVVTSKYYDIEKHVMARRKMMYIKSKLLGIVLGDYNELRLTKDDIEGAAIYIKCVDAFLESQVDASTMTGYVDLFYKMVKTFYELKTNNKFNFKGG